MCLGVQAPGAARRPARHPPTFFSRPGDRNGADVQRRHCRLEAPSAGSLLSRPGPPAAPPPPAWGVPPALPSTAASIWPALWGAGRAAASSATRMSCAVLTRNVLRYGACRELGVVHSPGPSSRVRASSAVCGVLPLFFARPGVAKTFLLREHRALAWILGWILVKAAEAKTQCTAPGFESLRKKQPAAELRTREYFHCKYPFVV